MSAKDRVILHVANGQDAMFRRMQEALLATGRTIVHRKDLYRAMGMLAASDTGDQVQAVIVATDVIGREEREFFQLLAAWHWSPRVYLYGEDGVGVDSRVRSATSGRITVDAIATLFPPLAAPVVDREPAKAEPMEEEAGVGGSGRFESPETTPEVDDREESASEAGGSHETAGWEAIETPEDEPAIEPAEVREVSEPGSDSADDKAEPAGGSAVEGDRPPVPWRPHPHLPTRIPPGARTLGAHGAGEDEKPLLSREELDALLNQEAEYPNSGEHTA